jgi:Ca2+-binding RTX toxin-like protein
VLNGVRLHPHGYPWGACISRWPCQRTSRAGTAFDQMYTGHNAPRRETGPSKGVTMKTSPGRNRRDAGASRAAAPVRRNARKIGSGVAVSAMLTVWVATASTPALGAVRTCHGEAATIVGTGHADRIVGTPHGDVIVAGAGSDLVVGRGGADLICGGPGDDRLGGGAGTDHLFGGSGRDVLGDSSGSLYDLLRGGPGADVLRSAGSVSGSSTARTLIGDAGADRIVSSGDGDRLRGGAGDDHLVALGQRGARPQSMTGNAGQDILRASRSGGTLRLRGDGDKVRVDFAAGSSVFLSYRHAPGPVTVDLQAGYGQVVGSTVEDKFLGFTDQPDSFLGVRGTSGNDILLGTDHLGTTDILDGRQGDDDLSGRDGPDSLWGHTGDDLLDGGPGSDRGSGGAGTDTCIDIEEILDC